MRPATFEEVATYVLAALILVASFYGLLRDNVDNNDVRAIYGGMIGAVSTWLFQERASKQATKHAIDAQNNGMQGVRDSVRRIEDNRTPSEAERLIRDAAHPREP